VPNVALRTKELTLSVSWFPTTVDVRLAFSSPEKVRPKRDPAPKRASTIAWPLEQQEQSLCIE